MALPEKLYELRKEKGISQEQLAEEIGVSRQAISKWESAKAMPESDKLILLSEYFGVSIDELLRGSDYFNMHSEPLKSRKTGNKAKDRVGMLLLSAGAFCLVYWGILTVANPAFTDRLAHASTVTIGGNGIYLGLCGILMGSGAWILLKNVREDK